MNLMVMNEYCKYRIFSIDNAHPNSFITPFGVLLKCIRQLAVELGSTDRTEEFFKSVCIASSNIESDEEF
jgi:hypothetical protein